MNKILFIVLIFTGLPYLAAAQDFGAGATKAELDMTVYDKAPNAHAVFLNEFGSSKIDEADDKIRLIYTYHAKIKIFDKLGFNNGSIVIPIRTGKDGGDDIIDISGTTYYKDDMGAVKKTKLDPKQIFTAKNYKYESTVKFAMPGLRSGCVIEYSYTIISPLRDDFRSWDFQADIPKIISQYEVHIPGFWTFNAALRGSLKLSSTTSDVEEDCFSSYGAKSGCSHITYSMADIPPFAEEDYMTAPRNFRSAIYFELVEYINPYTNSKTVVSKEWKDVDHQLKIDPEFGAQLKHTTFFEKYIAPLAAGKNDELDKAQAIYAWLQKWCKWNNYTGIYSTQGFKDVINTHTGNVADINLALVTALNEAGISADPVLLSTRDNGMVNMLYPVLNDFNYVIAQAKIGDKTYLLDATDPLLSFGLLPLRCINDKGRVISLKNPSYWIALSSQQKATTTHSFELTLLDKGKLKGTISNVYKGYDAYEKRRAIKSFNSADEYIESIDERQAKLKILKSQITNLDSLNQPLTESFEVEINAFDSLNHNTLVFNPFLWEKRTTNPFKLTERDYPVDWGMASDNRLIMTMHLPQDYAISTPPQVVTYKLPNQGGMFATAFEPGNSSFTFSSILQFNKSVYDPAEYPYLKELYNQMILAEKNGMVLRKTP